MSLIIESFIDAAQLAAFEGAPRRSQALDRPRASIYQTSPRQVATHLRLLLAAMVDPPPARRTTRCGHNLAAFARGSRRRLCLGGHQARRVQRPIHGAYVPLMVDWVCGKPRRRRQDGRCSRGGWRRPVGVHADDPQQYVLFSSHRYADQRARPRFLPRSNPSRQLA